MWHREDCKDNAGVTGPPPLRHGVCGDNVGVTRVPLGALWGPQEGHGSPHTGPRHRATLTSCPAGAPWAVGDPGRAVGGRGAGGAGLQQAGGRRGDGAAHPEVLEGTELLVALEAGLEAIAEEPRAGYAGGGEGDLVPAQPLGVGGHGRARRPSGETPKWRRSARHGDVGRGCEKKAGLTLGRANRRRAGPEVTTPTRGAPALSKLQPSTAQLPGRGQSERAEGRSRAAEPITASSWRGGGGQPSEAPSANQNGRPAERDGRGTPPRGSASGSRRHGRDRDPLPLAPEVPFRGLIRCTAAVQPPARRCHGGRDRSEPAVRVQGGECGPRRPLGFPCFSGPVPGSLRCSPLPRCR